MDDYTGLSESRFLELFEDTSQGACMMEILFDRDPVDYRFIAINDHFEEQTGLIDPVGKTARELVPELEDFWFEAYSRVARTRQPVHFNHHATVMGHWFDVQAFPIGEPERNLVGLLFNNITTRRRRELYREFLNQINEHFTKLQDIDEIVFTVGIGLARLLKTPRVVMGEFPTPGETDCIVYDFTAPEPPKKSLEPCLFARDLHHLARGEMIETEDQSLDFLAVPHLSGGELRFVLAVAQEPPAEWGEDQKDLLRNLIARLWYRLESARTEEELRATNERKEKFLATLSHELRNPLTSIKMGLQILSARHPKDEDERHARDVIARQIEQLTRLVDDLLDVTRINHGKIQLRDEEMELNQLLKAAVEDHLVYFQHDEKTLSFHGTDEPIHVEGDPSRLAQAIGNLLHNAAKFTYAGGRCDVTLRFHADPPMAEILIADDGIGIDASILNELFEPFVQAETSLDRTDVGLGLGLALVRGIVGLHGGSIRARSSGSGQGATFVLRLPAHQIQRRLEEQKPTPRSLTALRVLVVEDDPDISTLLEMILKARGHEVRLAATGVEGIGMAQEDPPDLVLCDLGLPGLDGFAVAKKLRETPALARTRLIAISGYARPQDVEKSLASGFDHHLRKPLDFELLEELLNETKSSPPPT